MAEIFLQPPALSQMSRQTFAHHILDLASKWGPHNHDAGVSTDLESAEVLMFLLQRHTRRMTAEILLCLAPSSLRNLCLKNCSQLVTEDLIRILNKCCSLTLLSLEGCQRVDAGSLIKDVGCSFTRLTTLNLSSCQVEDQHVQALLVIAENLKHLSLADTAIGDQAFLLPSSTQQLLETSTSSASQVRAGLVSVDVSGCLAFSCQGLLHLCILCGASLRSLNLQGTKVGPKGMLYLCGHSQLSAEQILCNANLKERSPETCADDIDLDLAPGEPNKAEPSNHGHEERFFPNHDIYEGGDAETVMGSEGRERETEGHDEKRTCQGTSNEAERIPVLSQGSRDSDNRICPGTSSEEECIPVQSQSSGDSKNRTCQGTIAEAERTPVQSQSSYDGVTTDRERYENRMSCQATIAEAERTPVQSQSSSSDSVTRHNVQQQDVLPSEGHGKAAPCNSGKNLQPVLNHQSLSSSIPPPTSTSTLPHQALPALSAQSSTLIPPDQTSSASSQPSTLIPPHQASSMSLQPSTLIPPHQATSMSLQPSTLIPPHQASSVSLQPSTLIPPHQASSVSLQPSTLIPPHQASSVSLQPSTLISPHQASSVSVQPSTLIPPHQASSVSLQPSTLIPPPQASSTSSQSSTLILPHQASPTLLQTSTSPPVHQSSPVSSQLSTSAPHRSSSSSIPTPSSTSTPPHQASSVSLHPSTSTPHQSLSASSQSSPSVSLPPSTSTPHQSSSSSLTDPSSTSTPPHQASPSSIPPPTSAATPHHSSSPSIPPPTSASTPHHSSSPSMPPPTSASTPHHPSSPSMPPPTSASTPLCESSSSSLSQPAPAPPPVGLFQPHLSALAFSLAHVGAQALLVFTTLLRDNPELRELKLTICWDSLDLQDLAAIEGSSASLFGPGYGTVASMANQLLTSYCSQILEAIGNALPGIEHLTVNQEYDDGNYLTDRSVAQLLAKCTRLVSLDLSGSYMLTDAAFLPLQGSGTLQALHLSTVGVRLAPPIFAPFKELTTLNLKWCEDLNEDNLNRALLGCPVLTHLNLHHCPVSNRTLSILALGCPKLLSLDISGAEGLDDQAMIALAASLTHLAVLNISHNRGLSDASVKALLACCKLEILKLSCIPNISEQPFLPIIQDVAWHNWLQALNASDQVNDHPTAEEGSVQQAAGPREGDRGPIWIPHRSASYGSCLKALDLSYCNMVNERAMTVVVTVCRGGLEVRDYHQQEIVGILGVL